MLGDPTLRANRLRRYVLAPYIGIMGCGLLPPVAVSPELAIEPSFLSAAVEGDFYEQRLDVDTDETVAWSVAEGELPIGLSLDTDTGTISGVPEEAGTTEFLISAVGDVASTGRGRASLAITVIERLTLDPILDVGRINESYADSFSVDGGIEPYTFALIGLPGGLDFDGSTATISGAPAIASSGLQLEVTVSDSGDPQQILTEQTVLVIRPRPVAVSTMSVPDGRLHVGYSVRLDAIDGEPPYTWAIIAGVLPDGLLLNLSAGVISGIPTSVQTATFVIEVTDSESPPTTDSMEFTPEIAP